MRPEMAVAASKTVDPSMEQIYQGRRNDRLFRMCAGMRGAGFVREAIVAAVERPSRPFHGIVRGIIPRLAIRDLEPMGRDLGPGVGDLPDQVAERRSHW